MRALLNDNSLRTHGPAATRTEFRPVRTADDIGVVAVLARNIWYEHYVPLIGRGQVEYMVAKFQSAPAIAAQIDGGYEYFLVEQAQTVGYLAVQEQSPAMFISKLYVTKGGRGAGTGRACMEFIEGAARKRGLSRLWLTVNKGNPAVHAYERLGFRVAESVVMDIGGGFVMDDFRMERDLT
jgi:diamine N-acetyltransferase